MSLIITRTKASSSIYKIIHPYSIGTLMSCPFDPNHQIYQNFIKIMIFPWSLLLVPSCPNPGINQLEPLLKILKKMGKSLNSIPQSWAITIKIKNQKKKPKKKSSQFFIMSERNKKKTKQPTKDLPWMKQSDGEILPLYQANGIKKAV